MDLLPFVREGHIFAVTRNNKLCSNITGQRRAPPEPPAGHCHSLPSRTLSLPPVQDPVPGSQARAVTVTGSYSGGALPVPAAESSDSGGA